jgi:hypothetical protein
MEATVVSAFYVMNSKFPPAQYMNWIQTFLYNLPCHLVFFTDEDLIPMLESMRHPFMEKTKFIALPRDQWVAYTKYKKEFWLSQQTKDHEAAIHSPDLYAIWYEKKEFVLRAAELNPFQHSHFIWCDAGAFRYPEWIPQLQTFGSKGIETRIPHDRLVLLQVEPFTDEDDEDFTLDRIGNFDRVNRIGGGIQGGTVDTWKRWARAYDEKLMDRVNKGLFVGKDQTIMASLVLQYPSLVQMIPANRTLKDHWFTLLYTFSPPLPSTKPFISILIPLYNGIEFLEETLESIENQTFKDYEILIGVNGHPPNSPVFQNATSLAKRKTRVYDFPTLEGKAATLNALTEKAQADWIALCDADDLWMPEKLEVQKQCIHHFQEMDVIGTQCEYFGDMTGSPSIPMGNISTEDFWKANPLLHSSVILKKSLAHWNPENKILEDYELWIRLRYQKRANLLNVPYVLMKHRIHTTSHFNTRNSQAVPQLLQALRQEIES